MKLEYFSSYKREPGYRPSSHCPWQHWRRPRRSMRRHLGQVKKLLRLTTKLMLISTCPELTWRSTGWTPTSSGSRWTTARTSTPTSCRKQMSFRWENNLHHLDWPWPINFFGNIIIVTICHLHHYIDQWSHTNWWHDPISLWSQAQCHIIYCYHHPLVIFPLIARFLSSNQDYSE